MPVQISAYIEDDIKQKMEDYAFAHGLKKGFLIQNALDYYLNALHEIPSGMMIPSQIRVDTETFEMLVSDKTEPTPKLKQLLQDD